MLEKKIFTLKIWLRQFFLSGKKVEENLRVCLHNVNILSALNTTEYMNGHLEIRREDMSLEHLKRAKICFCSSVTCLNVNTEHEHLGQRQRKSIFILSAARWLRYHRSSLFISKTVGGAVLACHGKSLWGRDDIGRQCYKLSKPLTASSMREMPLCD